MKADEGSVARRYAKAAMLYCDAHGGHDRFEAGLARLCEALAAVPVLRSLLSTPVVKREKKVELLDSVAAQVGMAAEAARFVRLLVVRNRTDYLEAVLTRFREMRDQKSGRLRGRVLTPVALAGPAQERIAKALSQRFGKEVVCTFDVDESLYGGVLARVGNTVIDSTIRGRLQRVRSRVREWNV